jgi:hypothetical protein
MEKIGISEVRKIAEKKKLRPGRVKGTDGIQFTLNGSERVEVITWEELESIIKKRRLAVYESSGFLKVMKA